MEANLVRRPPPAAGVLRLAAPAIACSFGACALLVASQRWTTSPLGVPEWWTWALMAVNLAALVLMSKGRAAGWVTAAALQPPTIVFCLLTGQRGFVVGSAISGVVHLAGSRRAAEGRA